MRKFFRYLTGFLVIGGILLFVASGLLPNYLKSEYLYGLLNNFNASALLDLEFPKELIPKEFIQLAGTDNKEDTTPEEDILTDMENEFAYEEEADDTTPATSNVNQVPEDADNEYGYCYSCLSEEERQIYREILSVLQKVEVEKPLSTVDVEVLDKAFNCVMLDHPELFYVTGYSITKFTRKDKIEKIEFEGRYTCDFDEAVKRQLLVDEAVSNCLSGISPDASEYEKVKYIYEYIIKNTEYDLDSAENQNILSVLLNNKSVCQGYAKSVQYLLNKLGVFCILVEGKVKDTESHVFNIVRIDGNYYFVDATWGDASYSLTMEDDVLFDSPDISYDYLCIPRSEIEKTHVINELVPLPVCDSMRDNYYVREGLLFENADEEKFQRVFDKAYADGDNFVTIKCSNQSSYEQVYDYLITREHIFDYLSDGNSINYVEMKEVNRFLFYLR